MTARVLVPCRSEERFKAHVDEHRPMSCCKAERVPFTGYSAHEGACCSDPDCGDCDAVLVDLRVRADRAELLSALQGVIAVAAIAADEWNRDEDSRVGKKLIALAGRCPGYRADIDAAHAAVAHAEGR